nr:hypothetical protein [Tanacetum cinerariifolium]
MDAPTLPVSAEKNPGDPIDIRVDIIHPTPADVFPTATVVRTLAQHGEAIRGIHGHLEGVPISEEMNALRFKMGMVEEENASLRGSIKTMEAIDTITRRQEKRAQAVQAMIDQTLLRNNTTDDGSQNSSGGPRRPLQPACVCSYTDFMKCQPLNFKGTEGIVGLSQWVEKMESVFHISGCPVENQVKFATCTLLGAALTWWNGHVRTLGHDAAYAMTWEILEKKLTDKYCPKGEIKKLEIELWNLKTEKVDKYISGLPDNIHGDVMAARPKTLDDAIELANDLIDQKLRTYAERQAENKRKLDNNHQAQQQLPKKQNVAQAYAIGTGEKKSYGGSKPLCPKCNYHHDEECAPKCANCKKIGHLTKDCWHPINANNQRTITYYECGNQGHYRSDFLVLKNQGTEARGMVYTLGGGETNQDLDNTEDDINA